MASIETRRNGTKVRHRVKWREGGAAGAKWCSESFDKKPDANRFKAQVDAAGQNWPEGWVPGRGFVNIVQTRKGLSLLAWAPRAIAARQGANARTKHDTLRDIRNHVPDWLGAKPMREISYEDVGTWLNELREKGLSLKTIKNVQGAVSSVVTQGIKDGHVDRNVFEGALKGVTIKATVKMDFMTPAEVQRILAAVTPFWHDFVWLLYATGMRFNEATALEPRHVDLVARTITVEQAYKRVPSPKGESGTRASKGTGIVLGLPKNDKSRVIPISDAICRMLAPYVRRGGKHLFLNTVENTVTHSNFYHAVWSPAVQRAALGRRPRIHDLRHSHAAFLLSHGTPTIVVKERLGHASIQITVDRYGHILPEVQDGVRGLLDEAYSIDETGVTALRSA